MEASGRVGDQRRVFTSTAPTDRAALDDDPHYVKALHRRAVANEKLDSWTGLSGALEGALIGGAVEIAEGRMASIDR